MSDVPIAKAAKPVATADIHAIPLERLFLGYEIGPMQADAVKVATHHQFVRPAEEKTKREELRQRGKTRRLIVSEVKYHVVLVALIALIAVRLVWFNTLDWLLVALIVAVLGGPAATDLVKQILQGYGIIAEPSNGRP